MQKLSNEIKIKFKVGTYNIQRAIYNSLPERLITYISYSRALHMARIVNKKVPSYNTLIKRNDIGHIKSINELPITDKKSYIQAFPIEELVFEPLATSYSLESSSGYSGKNTYWPSTRNQDEQLKKYTELGLVQTMKIHSRKTLFINTFLLGAWVTGEKLSRIMKEIGANPIYNLTTISIGLNIDEVLECIESFKDQYDQIILAGYPPFLKKIIEGLSKNKYENLYFGIISGGEGFPESWRIYIKNLLKRMKVKGSEVVSAYGSADTGLSIGYETSLSIAIRNLAYKNKEILASLSENNISYTPAILQYNPLSIYLEEVNKNIIFTRMGAIPLIRYNLKDKGTIVSYSQMKQILSAHNVDISNLAVDSYKMPFIILHGREDGSISINGTNIYIESIHELMNREDLVKLHTGKYTLRKDSEHGTKMVLEVEIGDLKGKTYEEYSAFFEERIIDFLKEKYKAYALIYSENPDTNRPIVKIRESQDQIESKTRIKNKYIG